MSIARRVEGDRCESAPMGKSAPGRPVHAPRRTESARHRYARSNRPSRLLLAFGALLIVALITGSAALIWEIRAHAISDAERQVFNLSLLLAEQTTRALQPVDHIIVDAVRAIQSREPRPPSAAGEATHEIFRAKVARMPHVLSLFVLDANGDAIHSSRSYPPPDLNAADRSYFGPHRDDPNVGLFISEPSPNRAQPGKRSFFLSRRLNGPGGAFAGVVTASLDLDYFHALYGAIDLAEGSTITLLHMNEILLAHHPHSGVATGTSVAESADAAPPDGDVDGPLGAVDGGRQPSGGVHITSDRALPNLPLLISVSVPLQVALADWRQQATAIGLGTLAAGLVIAMLVALLVRQFARGEQREHALHESEARYRNILDNMADTFYRTDVEGRIVMASRSAASLLGYPIDELIGRPLAEFYVDDDGRSAFLRQLDEGGGNVVSYEAALRHRDGRVVWVSINAHYRRDEAGSIIGVEGTARDVTERKLAENALRASEARLARILEIVPEGVVAVDEMHRIRLFNQGAEHIFGYTAEEILGQSIDILIPTRSRARHKTLIEDFGRAPEHSRTISQRREIAGLRRDGTEFPAEASVSKLKSDGEWIYTVLLRDVTERKQIERVIVVAKEQAELASRAKSEFLANMSHELRTPLNAILGFSEIIRDRALGDDEDKYNQYAADIHTSGDHLLQIINDILDLAKIEAGQTELDEDRVDVADIVLSCLRLVEERARDAGVELSTDIATALPALRADTRKLKQILINLLSNAVKFTPEGGSVVVHARLDSAGELELTVRDTGIGISSADIPRALAPFNQIDRGTLNRRHEGTGLGLPLVRSLCELHGGTFSLDSEVNVGTAATVRFPAQRVA